MKVRFEILKRCKKSSYISAYISTYLPENFHNSKNLKRVFKFCKSPNLKFFKLIPGQFTRRRIASSRRRRRVIDARALERGRLDYGRGAEGARRWLLEFAHAQFEVWKVGSGRFVYRLALVDQTTKKSCSQFATGLKNCQNRFEFFSKAFLVL